MKLFLTFTHTHTHTVLQAASKQSELVNSSSWWARLGENVLDEELSGEMTLCAYMGACVRVPDRSEVSHSPDLVTRWAAVEVFPDGIVVHGGGERDEHVPDGVSKWNYTIWFKEDHA